MASKPLYIVIAAVGIAATSAAAWWYQRKPPAAAPESPRSASAPAASGNGATPVVEVARVEVQRLVDEAQAVGSLRSRQSVMLRPEVSGRVTRINFRDGERVRRGQLLVQLDDQLPMAQVQQARAELSIARANHKRNQDLAGQGFISQRQVEESAANLQVADAKLALAEATAARLRILAPFDAITGIRSINVGDYLKDGADIVNLEDLDAVYVDFRLPERYQSRLRRGQAAIVQTDTTPGRRWPAVVLAIDPAVDANGRSIGIRACIDNRQMVLRPGMFARVNVIFGERENALVVPEEAIVPQGNRVSVYRVVGGPDQDSKAAQRVDVKLGLRSPGRVEIVDGLRAGDLVVTAGQQRLQRDGTVVRLMNAARAVGPAAAPADAGGPASPNAPRAATVGGGAAVAAPAPAAGPSPCTVSALAGAQRAGRAR